MEGVGGLRHARFEGGVLFLETVTEWEKERRLAFTIAAQTETIPPTTLDPHVTIGGPFFDVLTGTYTIEPLPDGKVRLHLARLRALVASLATIIPPSDVSEGGAMLAKEAMSQFLSHCRYEKNLSPKTIRAYSIDLRQFLDYLAAREEAATVAAVDKTVLRDYIKVLFEGSAEKTVKRKVATLKVWLNFLDREDLVTVNPFRKLDVRIRETKRLPRTLDLADIQRLFRHLYKSKQGCSDRNSYSYRALVRDIALLETLFATGARVSEVCHLSTEDIDLRLGRIRILGKGGRERLIQVCDEEALAILKEYRALWAADLGEGEHFFRNRAGGRLTDQSVRASLRRYAAGAGLTLHVTPHMFRHSLATLLLEEGVDLRYIQHLLGHSSVATTQIYAQVRDRHQWRVLERNHPRRRFRLAQPP